MARAYKCDRCGAFYDCNTDRKITTRRYDSISAQREHDDLCEKCAQELMEWFAEGMDTLTIAELKQCPFCGRKPKINDLGKVKILSCEFSGCAVHPRICYTVEPEKEEKAIRAWNWRVDDAKETFL